MEKGFQPVAWLKNTYSNTLKFIIIESDFIRDLGIKYQFLLNSKK